MVVAPEYRPRPGAQVVLHANRGPAIRNAILSVVIGIAAFIIRTDNLGVNRAIAIAGLIVAMVCIAVLGLSLASLPSSVNRLTLSDQGFTMRRWFNDRFVPWALVRGFHVGGPTRFSLTALWGSVVVFRLRGDAPWQRKDRRHSVNAAPDLMVTSHSGLGAEEMCALLELWRETYTSD